MGIYTVLVRIRAKTLQDIYKDKVFFIGPDVGRKREPLFIENENLCAAWREHALKNDGLKVRRLGVTAPSLERRAGPVDRALVEAQGVGGGADEVLAGMAASFGVRADRTRSGMGSL